MLGAFKTSRTCRTTELLKQSKIASLRPFRILTLSLGSVVQPCHLMKLRHALRSSVSTESRTPLGVPVLLQGFLTYENAPP